MSHCSFWLFFSVYSGYVVLWTSVLLFCWLLASILLCFTTSPPLWKSCFMNCRLGHCESHVYLCTELWQKQWLLHVCSHQDEWTHKADLCVLLPRGLSYFPLLRILVIQTSCITAVLFWVVLFLNPELHKVFKKYCSCTHCNSKTASHTNRARIRRKSKCWA